MNKCFENAKNPNLRLNKYIEFIEFDMFIETLDVFIETPNVFIEITDIFTETADIYTANHFFFVILIFARVCCIIYIVCKQLNKKNVVLFTIVKS